MNYRKKPVVIEAMQMPSEKDQAAIEEIVEWMSPGLVAFAMTEEAGIDPFDNGPVSGWGVNYLYINTLEGEMNASLGDYIIRGIQGEFYPCKPGIFEATYEPA